VGTGEIAPPEAVDTQPRLPLPDQKDVRKL
jgi:hypothetical protein